MNPTNNRGMRYQSNGKELGNTMQYLVGGGQYSRITFNRLISIKHS